MAGATDLLLCSLDQDAAVRKTPKYSNRCRRRHLQIWPEGQIPMSIAIGPQPFLVKLAIAAVGGCSTDRLVPVRSNEQSNRFLASRPETAGMCHF